MSNSPKHVATEEEELVEMLEEAELELPPSPAPRPNPSKLRFALLMVVAVYPIITLLLYVVMPLTANWAIWHRTLVIAPIMVFSIVFFRLAHGQPPFRLVRRGPAHAAPTTGVNPGIPQSCA